MTRAGPPQSPASTLIGKADLFRRLAGIALPFLAILPFEYRVPLETALMMLFPNAG